MIHFTEPMLLSESHMAWMASVKSVPSPKLNDVRMAATTQAASAKSSAQKITAVLPIYGFIDQRDSFMLQVFGGTAIDSLMEAIGICCNEPRISGIVLDCATPGGSAFGVKEGADEIFKACQQVPIVAVSNCMMASAGYYLASAASRIYASPSSVTGSIGVLMEHQDESKALADGGVTSTIVRVPPGKAQGHPSEPLSPDGLSAMEQRCQYLYDQMTADIARYRGTTQALVKEKYGAGRVLSAADALECGMVDRLGTFADVVGDMQSGKMQRSLAQGGRMEETIDSAVLRNRAAMYGISLPTSPR